MSSSVRTSIKLGSSTHIIPSISHGNHPILFLLSLSKVPPHSEVPLLQSCSQLFLVCSPPPHPPPQQTPPPPIPQQPRRGLQTHDTCTSIIPNQPTMYPRPPPPQPNR